MAAKEPGIQPTRMARFSGEPNISMSQRYNYPAHEDIAALAQKFWEEEGQPEGKAETHWQRAEAQFRAPQRLRKAPKRRVGAGAA